MRYDLLQLALGLALVSLALLHGGAAWALAWPGVTLVAVGVAYFGVGPRVFGKREDGSLPPLRVALLAPYLLSVALVCRLKSLGENAFDEVAPGIYVGRRPRSASDVPRDVRLVVDLTSELWRAPATRSAERYLCLPTLDTDAPGDDAFAAGLDAIVADARPTLVHCAMGHGRSAMFAAALMIRRGLAEDVDDAVSRMRSARPRVYLRGPQREAVVRVTRTA